jgi:hypothetical protein
MSNSAMAMNMGNGGKRRRKREIGSKTFRDFILDRCTFPDFGRPFLNNSIGGFCAKRTLCELRRENDFEYSGKGSGLIVSTVLAILISDVVANLSAEEAVQMIENVDRETNCKDMSCG